MSLSSNDVEDLASLNDHAVRHLTQALGNVRDWRNESERDLRHRVLAEGLANERAEQHQEHTEKHYSLMTSPLLDALINLQALGEERALPAAHCRVWMNLARYQAVPLEP